MVWSTFWQGVATAGLLGSVGGLIKMYTMGIEHAGAINQLRKDVDDHKGELHTYSERLRGIETTTAVIARDVKTLLEVQTRESTYRQGQGHGQKTA